MSNFKFDISEFSCVVENKKGEKSVSKNSTEQTRQNKRIEALEVTVRQINDLTLSVQKLAINMEHMLVNQTEQNKRLEELENRDGEKWRSISMYVLTAVVGAVIGFVLKQAGL